MIQGTTPAIRLTLPFDARMCSHIRVAFISGPDRKEVLSKDIEDSDITESTVLVPLTQEETRLMEGLVVLEVRAKTRTGQIIGFDPEPLIMADLVDEVEL